MSDWGIIILIWVCLGSSVTFLVMVSLGVLLRDSDIERSRELDKQMYTRMRAFQKANEFDKRYRVSVEPRIPSRREFDA